MKQNRPYKTERRRRDMQPIISPSSIPGKKYRRVSQTETLHYLLPSVQFPVHSLQFVERQFTVDSLQFTVTTEI